MCGIFGILVRAGAPIGVEQTRRLLRELYILSESRGKESAGLHMYTPDSGNAWTIKGAQPASKLLSTTAFNRLVQMHLPEVYSQQNDRAERALVLLAHSRLVTNGTAELPQNNQPVRSGHVTMIHNGIIVNVEELWRKHSNLHRAAEVDTEVMTAILNEEMAASRSPMHATRKVFSEIRGAASIAWTDDRTGSVVFATNTGDLHVALFRELGVVVFASEAFILREALSRSWQGHSASIEWLAPQQGLLIDLLEDDLALRFELNGECPSSARPFLDRSSSFHEEHTGGETGFRVAKSSADEKLLRYNEASMRQLRRCTRCVLPETFPFITFDSAGVCSYCRNYRPRYAHLDPKTSKEQFISSLEKYRRAGGTPDALVAFSGGRDSSYGLHLIKTEFGLTPITFTYDWGMVTDLARRNVARICGQLGIQNLLVSADLAKKRENIRKNVTAWLRKPDLGIVPLFMAGDKHFFHVVNQLKRQTGVRLDLWCANPLENTDFKSGFCGVAPDFGKSRVDYLSFGRKIQLGMYYAGQFLSNPRYINSSISDTVGAFLAYYVEPRRDFYFIFDHFVWDEREVNRVLLSEYDWELAPDSPSTWRIGDGTAPFYNYIYMTARGFTEFDTFRSNQIREGMLTREEALNSILVENRPRTESLKWYLQTIDVDFNAAIRRINELDVLGLHVR